MSAAAALFVVIYTSLRDCHPPPETRDRDRGESRVGGQGAFSLLRRDNVEGIGSAPAPPAPPAPPEETISSTTVTTSATLDAGTSRAAAAPTLASSAPSAEASRDAGAASNASTPATDDTTLPERRGADAPDARAPNPWAPPSMSAGAGPFLTEAPYWGASAFTPNPNAGAGPFTTDAPPWSSSAFTSNPNAGAGPFTTERNIPAFGVWPGWAPVAAP